MSIHWLEIPLGTDRHTHILLLLYKDNMKVGLYKTQIYLNIFIIAAVTEILSFRRTDKHRSTLYYR